MTGLNWLLDPATGELVAEGMTVAEASALVANKLRASLMVEGSCRRKVWRRWTAMARRSSSPWHVG